MDVYYLNTNGPDDTAILQGLRWLRNQCIATGKEGIIATPQKNSLTNALQNAGFEASSIRDLLRNEFVQTSQIRIRLLTTRVSFPRYHDGIVLVIHPNQKILSTIDNLSELTSALIIPWSVLEIQEWLTSKNATQIPIEVR